MKTYHFKSVVLSSLVALLLSQAPAFADSIDRLYDIPESGPPVDTQVEGWRENIGSTLPFSFSPFDDRSSDFIKQIAGYSFNTVLGVCATPSQTGCIESIRYSADGLNWHDAVFKGTLQQREMAYGMPTQDADDPWNMQLTSTWDANPSIGLLEASLPNEFELPKAPNAIGNDITIFEFG